MAITSNQAESVATQAAFLQRVEFQICLAAENIVSESAATAKHAQRAALASQVLNSPAAYAANWAPAVVAQFNLATTSMVGTTDVDTTDSALGTIVASIWNDFLPSP
jgi:hypothetical protein